MKKAIIAAAVLVVAVVGFFVVRSRGGDEPAEQAAGPAAPAGTRPTARAQAAEMPEFRFVMDDDREGTLRLEGQVVDAEREPVGGATVRLDSNPPREATSEADGSFYFDKLVGREYTLVARADTGVAGPVTQQLTAQSEPVILIVKAGAVVEVNVRASADRKPIDGATVELRGLSSQSARTGADGLARFEHVPDGGYQVAARADGFAQASTWTGVDGTPSVERIELELKRGAAVAGRVVDAAGKPLEGAVVLYSGASDWSQQADPRFDGVLTDGKGEFRIAAMPAGTFRFRARHSDFATGTSEPVTLDGRTERTGVVIQLQPGAVLAGVVVDEQGAPVAAAAVRVSQGGPGMRFAPPRQAFADDAGKFEMRGLPRDEIEVVAVHETATSETAMVDLAAVPEKTDLTLKLDVTGRIAGIVNDTEGEPVEGAQVLLSPDWRRGDGPGRADFRLRGMNSALTDAGGRWEFRGLQELPYQVRANPPGVTGRGAAWLREGVDANVGDMNVVIVLPRDGSLRGKVAYDDGTPAELFTVSLGGFRGGTPFSTEDGVFEIGDVPPQSYTVTLRGPGFEQKQVPDVEVAPGQQKDLGTITVRKGRTIAGRVVTAQRQPVPGASVVVGKVLFGSGSTTAANARFGPPGTQRNKTVTTDDNGEFAVHGVASHDLNLIAEHESHGRTMPVTVPGSRESVYGLELVMEATGALEGMVTMGGKPAEDVRVSCQSQLVPSAIFGVATGADGKFRFDRLAPGSYMVSAMTGGNPMRGMGFHDGTTVAIESNKTSSVTLEIAAGDIELEVKLAATTGEVGFAQIFSVQMDVTARTAREFQMQTAMRNGGYSSFGMSIAGRPAVIREIAPGAYTVCAAPYPTEVQGMQPTIDYMEREGDHMPIYCKKVTVTPEPQRQEMTIDVVIPPFVPPDDGA